MNAFASMCLLAAFAAEPVAGPQAAAEAFLAAEYAASPNREERVLHAARPGQAAADDWGAEVYEPTWDAAVVVRTPPRVARASASGATGAADVVFTPVARIEAGGRVVPAAASPEEHVTLKLASENGRWWVVDPGPAIVGLDALIAAYRAEANAAPGAQAPSPAERASRDRVLANLAKLESLRGAPAK